MIRMTRLTDYGILLLTHFAKDQAGTTRSARDLAHRTKLSLPTVSKVLKNLAHEKLLVAHRGTKGGFSLAHPAEEITVLEILSALEGPLSLTECGSDPAGKCDLEHSCPVGTKWKKINAAVLGALQGITLAEMAEPSWSPVEFRPAAAVEKKL